MEEIDSILLRAAKLQLSVVVVMKGVSQQGAMNHIETTMSLAIY